MRAPPIALALLALTSWGCKRKTPPVADAAWLGPHTACARIKGTGEVRCWGDTTHGALRLAEAAAGDQPVPAPSLIGGSTRALALGQGFSCALDPAGVVSCWGDDGRPAPGSAPRTITDAAVTLASGPRNACASKRDGALVCWGDNSARQIPSVSAAKVPDAVAIELPGKARAVALGARHMCAYTEEPRAVRCSGDPANGRLGVELDEIARAGLVALTAGDAHTCALTAGARVHCWGQNDAGQLGDGTRVESARPVLVAAVDGARAIAAGRRHTCALLKNGTVSCWGANDVHQLADGTSLPRPDPVALHGIVGVAALLAAGDGACVLLGDGQLRCWGRNDHGQLGDGSRIDHDVPMPVRFSLTPARVVASAGRY